MEITKPYDTGLLIDLKAPIKRTYSFPYRGDSTLSERAADAVRYGTQSGRISSYEVSFKSELVPRENYGSPIAVLQVIANPEEGVPFDPYPYLEMHLRLDWKGIGSIAREQSLVKLAAVARVNRKRYLLEYSGQEYKEMPISSGPFTIDNVTRITMTPAGWLQDRYSLDSSYYRDADAIRRLHFEKQGFPAKIDALRTLQMYMWGFGPDEQGNYTELTAEYIERNPVIAFKETIEDRKTNRISI